MIEAFILFTILMGLSFIFVMSLMVKEIKILKDERRYYSDLSDYYRDLYLGLLQKGIEDESSEDL